MFGVSFPEFLVLGTVALLVLGPEKLPGMLRTMGTWLAKARKLTTEVRTQSGIDEVLRAEGFDGGLNEFRSLIRGGAVMPSHAPPPRPAPEVFVPDRSREYPTEGPDAYGALPEDLVSPPPGAAAALPPAPEPVVDTVSPVAGSHLVEAPTPDAAPTPAIPTATPASVDGTPEPGAAPAGMVTPPEASGFTPDPTPAKPAPESDR